MATTHYYATAEGSGTLASILPADLAAAGFLDDGFAFDSSINHARSPTGNYTSPPDEQAWSNLGAIARARGISLTIDAEGDLTCDYARWLSNNAGCRTTMDEI